MQELLNSGINVQLRHDPLETSWENVVEHGYIAVYDAADKLLVRRDGFQHNRKLRAGGAYDNAAINEIAIEVKKLVSASAVVEAVDLNAAAEQAKAGAAAA